MQSFIQIITKNLVLGLSRRDSIVTMVKRAGKHYARFLHTVHLWVQAANRWLHAMQAAVVAARHAVERIEHLCLMSRLQPCRQPASDAYGSLGSDRRV